MIVVVDSNIVFSAIISPNGTISDLLLNSSGVFDFYSPTTILDEINNHTDKILKISGLSLSDFGFLKRVLFKKLELIDLEFISNKSWKTALELTKDVDEFDAPFVALSLELSAPLWTGDKKLRIGLENQSIDWVLDTAVIREFRNEK